MSEQEKIRPIWNELASEYIALQRELRRKQARLDELKSMFHARGSFATTDYIVAIRTISRRCIGPMDKIITVLGFDKLGELGLLYDSQVTITSVTPKGKPLETV